MRLRDEEL
jgi:hypothetical protein